MPAKMITTCAGLILGGKSARGLIGIAKNHNRDCDADDQN
jgi:hypothetical protein